MAEIYFVRYRSVVTRIGPGPDEDSDVRQMLRSRPLPRSFLAKSKNCLCTPPTSDDEEDKSTWSVQVGPYMTVLQRPLTERQDQMVTAELRGKMNRH